MKSLNYSVPIQRVIPTVVQNVSQVVSILPSDEYDKVLLGHAVIFNNTTFVSTDFISTTLVDAWNLLQFDSTLYMETVSSTRAMWRDLGIYNKAGAYWYQSAIQIPARTRLINHFANLNVTSNTVGKLITVFFVARTVVYK